MEFRTVAGVELGTVGMDWPTSTGPFTLTAENLQDIVTAAMEDPHIQIPRIKLGHTSEINGELRIVDPFEDLGDAAPAFGRVDNLRLENDGMVLVGDFIDMPEWLADGLAAYYANRSGEWREHVETPGGKRYSMVLTAMALLGVGLPAIQDLEDLEALLTNGPDLETEPATTASDPQEGGMEPEQTDTSVSAGTIRQRFNFDWAMNPESVFEGPDGEDIDPYWWWARDVRVDPSEVIAEDDEGNTWSVPFETDGADEVSFGDPVRVREDFVPIATAAGEQSPSFERPEKPERSQTAARPEQEDTTMDVDRDALVRRLGLPEDATDEQISEALEAEPQTPVGGEGANPSEGTEGGGEGEGTEVNGGEPQAASGDGAGEGEGGESTPTSVAGMTPEHLRDLTERAARGDAARTEQERQDRERFIEAALADGKFARPVADSYRAQLDQGGEIERTTREFIDALPKNAVVPTGGETGTAGNGEQTSADYPANWFPEAQKAREAAASGETSFVTKE